MSPPGCQASLAIISATWLNRKMNCAMSRYPSSGESWQAGLECNSPPPFSPFLFSMEPPKKLFGCRPFHEDAAHLQRLTSAALRSGFWSLEWTHAELRAASNSRVVMRFRKVTSISLQRWAGH